MRVRATAYEKSGIALRRAKDTEESAQHLRFEVTCVIKPSGSVYTLTNEKRAEESHLLDVLVNWEFRIVGADDMEFYRESNASEPAKNFGFQLHERDPAWAAYSVMQDSAYHNYCRSVTGRLGLEPPEAKDQFVYQGNVADRWEQVVNPSGKPSRSQSRPPIISDDSRPHR